MHGRHRWAFLLLLLLSCLMRRPMHSRQAWMISRCRVKHMKVRTFSSNILMISPRVCSNNGTVWTTASTDGSGLALFQLCVCLVYSIYLSFGRDGHLSIPCVDRMLCTFGFVIARLFVAHRESNYFHHDEIEHHTLFTLNAIQTFHAMDGRSESSV
jgi:hypothetical protein